METRMEADLCSEAGRHHRVAHLRDDIEARRQRLLTEQRLARTYHRVDELAVCRGGRDDYHRFDTRIVDDGLRVPRDALEGTDRPLSVAALLVAGTTVASIAPAAAKKPSPPPSLTLCDPIDSRQCNMPFPNNFNTRTDASSPTGVRLNFLRDAMPKNVNGVTLDPSD